MKSLTWYWLFSRGPEREILATCRELGIGADLAAIETTAPADAVAGERYPAPLMATLDSER